MIQTIYMWMDAAKKRGKLYLGSIIELDGSLNVDVRKRTCDGRKLIVLLNSISWNRNIIKELYMESCHLVLGGDLPGNC